MTGFIAMSHSTALRDVTKPITSATDLPLICYVDDAFYQHK